VAAVVFSSASLQAQSVTGTIAGVVRDPVGAAVTNIKVTARNVGTNAEFTTTTNEFGQYKFSLVSGEYGVEVEAPGFRKVILSPQKLAVNDVLREDVNLEVGPVTEAVTVDANPTRVNTEDAQLGQSLQNVSSLPILSGANGRNPLTLVGIQPGVTFFTGTAIQVGPFTVNGQRTQANNYVLDGGDSNDLAINTPDSVTTVSPNALSEFRVVTGAMKAEYGRNSGAVVMMTTKSGTNSWHGGASEIFRNTKLNAVPFFQKSPSGGTTETFANGLPRKPQWNSNDFDANFGGRIIKDKTFFFVSYLGFRRRQGVTNTATVPSDSDRALIDQYGTPTAKALMAQVPHASPGTPTTLFTAPSNFSDRDQGLVRIDHSFTSKNRLSGTWFVEDGLTKDPFAFSGSTIPGFGQQGKSRRNNIVLSDTHTFTPNLVNEIRGSYHRLASQGVVPLNTTKLSTFGITGVNADDASSDGPPWIAISGYSSFGNTIQGPQSRFDNTTQLIDNVSWVRERHVFKFGGEVRSYAQNQLFTFINNGFFSFDGTGTDTGLVKFKIPGISSSALNDFANGFSTEVDQSNSNRQGYRERAYDLFVQDDWKITRRLTLNLGLRWEYDQGLKEVHNQVSQYRAGLQSTVFPDAPLGLVYYGDKGVPRSTYGEDLNNFAPRVGIAWDVFGNGKLAIRSGFGVFYDIPISELTLQFLGVLPFGIQTAQYNVTDYRNPYSTSLVNPIANPYPFHPVAPGSKFDFAGVAPIGLTMMDPNFRTPYGLQFNTQVQYEINRDWNLDVGYVGTTGVKLLSRRQVNPGIPGPGATSGNINPRRVLNIGNPLDAAYGGAVYGGITDQLSDANSNYNSLQVGLTKRFSHGLIVTQAYTWSHAIDNASGLRTNSRVDSLLADRGNTEFDNRHRYVGTYSYELPFFKNSNPVVKQIAAGWGVSGVTTFQSGFPFNIVDGQDRCLCGSGSGTNRPDYIGGNLVFYDPRNVSTISGRPNSFFDGTGGGTGGATTNPFFRRVGTSATYAAGAGRYGNLGRNVFAGPGINNWDLRVFKTFAIKEQHKLEFWTEFLNAFNHTQFNNPTSDINSVNFGRVLTARDPRVIQLTLRYSF
jgi:hypothetical protein